MNLVARSLLKKFLVFIRACISSIADPDVEHLLGFGATQFKRASSLFILKLKETRQLSQTAVDDVVEGCKSMISHTVQRLHSGARAKLLTLGIDEEALDDVFNDFPDPFNGLETRYLQEKFLKEEFGLVVCIYIAMYTYIMDEAIVLSFIAFKFLWLNIYLFTSLIYNNYH